MKLIECIHCGSKELVEENGFLVCAYCQNRYEKPVETEAVADTAIELDSDIEILLQKCQKDPRNCRRYANLILDIDPSNEEALRYLK